MKRDYSHTTSGIDTISRHVSGGPGRITLLIMQPAIKTLFPTLFMALCVPVLWWGV